MIYYILWIVLGVYLTVGICFFTYAYNKVRKLVKLHNSGIELSEVDLKAIHHYQVIINGFGVWGFIIGFGLFIVLCYPIIIYRNR